jgi:ferric-dicitrate binding protein FerR (iron transport regulator)
VTGTRRKTTDAPPEDLLNTSPFEGDLAEQLEAEPRPRRRPPSVTVLLGVAVVLVGGFIGGVQADRHWGAKKSSDPAALLSQLGRRTGAGQAGGGAFGGGQAGQFPGGTGTGTGQAGGSGNGTSGTVKLVDGDTIYVQTPSGIVRVKTTKSTKVTIAKKATAKSLKTGSPVVVQGTPGQDGTVTATSVQGG